MFNKLICKIFGHCSSTQRFILQTQNVSLNRADFIGREIICDRCGKLIGTFK